MSRDEALALRMPAPARPEPHQSREPSLAWTLLQRDLRLALRRRGEALLPLGFFGVIAGLQPLGIGSDLVLLRQLGPGLIWMAALLAALLPLPALFATDQADGTLDQLMLSGEPLWLLALAKAAAHWLVSSAALVLLAPLLGLLYGLSGEALLVLVAGLAIGTPVLSLVGTLGAALTTGVRSAGALILLLVLPLLAPVLIFGAGAVQAVLAGQSAAPHLSLLGAEALLALVGSPFLTAQALRIAQE
ncbi:heme exporter protein CcmB [Paucibacter sp. JuS9]|uniref:heme exporter protein CcmB n=1 Tax=Paucibacter sp. JuS9 TaxID=3228748 RepID=UPI003757575F